MKKILCFGDSNTFGYNPADCSRYPREIRWTGILSEFLGNNFEVIEAGCNNRNCFAYNPDNIELNSNIVLPKYLAVNPDIVILAVGINDLQKFYNPTYKEFEEGVKNLISITKATLPSSKIILCAPAKITSDVLTSVLSFQFDNISIEKSLNIQAIYKKIADETSSYYINLDEIVHVSKFDGLHFDPEEHTKIAKALYDIIINLI